MIKAKIFQNKTGNIFAFEITDHGEDIVCSAVTILSQNTANSIESFTDTEFICEYEEEGGYFYFEVCDNINMDDGTIILLKSLYLGLKSIEEEYGDNILLSIEEVG